MKDNKIYNTALYCRLSLDDGSVGESESIQTQKIILEEYAKIQEFKIYDVYVDDGYSGLNFNRPGFQRMIQDIQGGKINLVITKDLSRLGRNYIETGYYTENYFKETQLFYCNSRYYSPKFCRFISPDSIEYLDPQSINGLNLYCYCMNNPIMYADPSGHGVIIAMMIGAGLGGAIGGALTPFLGLVVTGFITGASNYSLGEIFATSLLIGSVSGITAGILDNVRIPGIISGRGS